MLGQQRHEQRLGSDEILLSPPDITLPNNVGMRLSFVGSTRHNGESIQCMDTIDTNYKGKHWKSSIVC